jgi:EmrB/QacA subfamily drug resistance transporter
MTILCANSSDDAIKPYAVLLVVGVGTLLAALAGSMVTLALPSIGRDLDISLGLSRWVILSFLLTSGVLLLVAGRLGDQFSHRRVYLFGFVLFGGASLACGLSVNFAQLIVFRLFQGVGGAMIMATGPALLTTSFPAAKRGRALGMLATATYLGLTAGPALGGWIVSSLDWRWTFFVAVPVAATVLVLGWRCLPVVQRGEPQPFDWAGTAALLTGLPLLLFALALAPRWGFDSWLTWTVTTLGIFGMVAFVLLQRTRSQPLLDLNLFRSRVFTGSVVSAVANYIALFVPIILLPFYLEEALGRTSAAAGLIMSTHPAVMALVASPSGWLSDRLGSRGLATVGMLVMAGGLLGMSTLGAGETALQVVVWLALMGLGTGIFISPNSSALMGAAPRSQQGSAGSIMAESRVLGMLIGVAVATAVFQAAGGRTGFLWREVDLAAFRVALRVAAGVALAGALAASLRGRKK